MENRESLVNLGVELTPALMEIEALLWENSDLKPNFPKEGFRGVVKLFSSAIMDKMYDLMERDEDIIDREAMGIKAMQDLRQYIKTYTDIDTKELYDGE